MPKHSCVCKIRRKPYISKHQWDDLTEQIAIAVESAMREQRSLRKAIKEVLDFYDVPTKKRLKAEVMR